MSTAEKLLLDSSSEYQIPLFAYETEQETQHNLLILPALGIAARFYNKLAETLSNNGINTYVLELRGYGESALRPSRRCNFGFKEILTEDISLALQAIQTRRPNAQNLLLGHSLGGHLAAMYCGLQPDQINGVILAACGSPWLEAYPAKTAQQIRLLYSLIPLTTGLLGYYPGHRLGFGSKEARQLMRDWRHMVKDNRYAAAGLSDNLDTSIAQYKSPVLVLHNTDDDFAPVAASQAVTQKFKNAKLSETTLSAESLGGKADHYRWAKQAELATQSIQDWLRTAP